MSNDLQWRAVTEDLPPDGTRIAFILEGAIEHGIVVRSQFRPWFISPYGRWAPVNFGGTVSLWMIDPIPDFPGRLPPDLKRIEGDSITALKEGFGPI